MSTYPQYLPTKDAVFATWLANFDSLLTATPANYGLEAADATALAAANTKFQAAYLVAIEPTTRTAPAVAAKDAARSSAEAVVRPLAVTISRNAAVTEDHKTGIGVNVPAITGTPIPPPTDQPVLSLISATPLNMLMAYKTSGAIGKSKPFGSIGTEIWRSVGLVAATSPLQTTFMGVHTKSPLRQKFTNAEQGQQVTFFARFVTRSGPQGQAQVGPWSTPLVLFVS
jgi:hypothetical protein